MPFPLFSDFPTRARLSRRKRAFLGGSPSAFLVAFPTNAAFMLVSLSLSLLRPSSLRRWLLPSRPTSPSSLSPPAEPSKLTAAG